MNFVAFAPGATHSLGALPIVPYEMSVMDLRKIAKVMALAASDNESEALHALRTARRLLKAHGSDFVELAARIGGDDGAGHAALEDAVFDLRNEVRALRAENERLKQGRGGAAGAEPSSMFDAARAASDVIRLRAELAVMAATLEQERGHTQAALADAAAAKARLTDAHARRMRLEVENRRLQHANHALTVELVEARAAPPASESVHDRKARVRARPRAKAGANQYALF